MVWARPCFLTVRGVVSTALHGGVVDKDHALLPGHPADAGDDPGPRHVVLVDFIGSQLGQFQKWRTRVEQGIEAFPWQQFATGRVPFLGPGAAALANDLDLGPQVVDLGLHGLAIAGEGGIPGV